METIKKEFIVIAGPTAVGKTAVSISLAKRTDGEIISADSMQIYREMDIGTAKISEEEMQGIPHHLISCVDPDEDFTVADYSVVVHRKISEIRARGKLPIIVGGTGLYINSLLYDMDFNASEPDKAFREEMESLRLEKGNEFLHALLAKKSPETAKSLHPNNYKRIIRALEILSQKEGFEPFAEMKKPERQKNGSLYILHTERERLYERINQRVLEMIQEGLEDEVRRLLAKGYSEELPSMKGIGYRQLALYIRGEISLDEAIEMIQRDSRRYAKRQITWFKRYSEAVWIDIQAKSVSQIVDRIVSEFYENRL